MGYLSGNIKNLVKVMGYKYGLMNVGRRFKKLLDIGKKKIFLELGLIMLLLMLLNITAY